MLIMKRLSRRCSCKAVLFLQRCSDLSGLCKKTKNNTVFVKYESGTGSVYYGKVTCTISLTAVNL